MRVVVVVPPVPVVTPQEAAEHLKVDDLAEEGAIIKAMVEAATAHIDGPFGWLGRAIGVQTLEAAMPTWCVAENFSLPYPPLIDIVSITYRDAQRQTVTVDPAAYEVIDGLVEAIGNPAWAPARPAKNGLRVRYRAGHEKVPAAIRAAILLMVGDLYRNRSTVSHGREQPTAVPMSTTVENLLAPFRVYA